MQNKKTVFAFDLDGTVTKEEILPILAQELGIYEEMKLLTKLTLNGIIDFRSSFKLRFCILNSIPLDIVHDIVENIRLDEQIEDFIKQNNDNCAIITGNLDVWIKPLAERLGCTFYQSTSHMDDNNQLVLDKIQLKSDAVRDLQNRFDRVIAIGESMNDIPMFEEADICIGYGGVHHPVSQIVQISDYICYEGGSLCQLLNML